MKEDYEWFIEADLSAYAGKWVAILNNRVIAAESDVGKLLHNVKISYPSSRPLIAKSRNKLSVL